jgi:Na+-driven multidrug efflux pump
LYTNNPAEIQYGLTRMQIIACTYFLCGFMDCLCYTLRGLGQSLLPTMVSLTGACLMRVVWIYTVFALYHTQFMLYISYPISWALTAAAHLVCYLVIRKKKFIQEPAAKLPG